MRGPARPYVHTLSTFMRVFETPVDTYGRFFVLAYAVLMLSRGGEVKFDIPHSTRRIIGRQASIDGVDGSQTYASVFFHNRRLYQIEGTVPAGGSSAEGIRFQQSFDFTDGWRLPDALSNELRAR